MTVSRSAATNGEQSGIGGGRCAGRLSFSLTGRTKAISYGLMILPALGPSIQVLPLQMLPGLVGDQ
jgi:hypothetical protein